MKNNNEWKLAFTFAVLGIIALTYLNYSLGDEQESKIKKLTEEKTEQNNLANTKYAEKTNELQETITDLQEQNKELQAELKTKSTELLKLTGTQRTQYEEQRNKWRNYAAGITSNLVKDLERTARNCWDTDRDDFEDCIDDEFEDDSDQEIEQILNLA